MDSLVHTFATLCSQAKENNVDPNILIESKNNLEKLINHDPKNVIKIIDDVLPDNVFVDLLEDTEFESFDSAKLFILQLIRRRNEVIFLIKLKDGKDPLDLIAYGNGAVCESIFLDSGKRRAPDSCLSFNILKKDVDYFKNNIHRPSPYFNKNVKLTDLVSNFENVKKLTESGNIPRWRNSDMETVLHYAIGCQQTQIVKFLISQKHPLDVRSVTKVTPLQKALEIKNDEFVKLLLNAGADPMFPTDIIPKIIGKGCATAKLFTNSDIQQYSDVFDANNSLSAFFNFGGKPTKELLSKAISRNNTEKIHLLCKKGAKAYNDILFDAVYSSKLPRRDVSSLVLHLLKTFKDIDGNYVDQTTGYTILFEFAEFPQSAWEIYQILEKRGLDVAHQDKNGNTILHVLKVLDRPKVHADILLKHPELRNVKNKEGVTPGNYKNPKLDDLEYRRKLFRLTPDQLQLVLDGTFIDDIKSSCLCF